MDCLLISLIFDILRYAVSSMFLGLLFSIISVGLLLLIIKNLYPKHTLTPLSYIVGAILFTLLFFQLVFVCGAFKIKGMADDMETSINNLTPKDQGLISGNEIPIAEQLQKKYPLLKNYVDLDDVQKYKVSDASEYMSGIRSALNNYILRRIGWSLSFIILGAFIVFKTMKVYCSTSMRGRNRTAMRSNGRGRGFR